MKRDPFFFIFLKTIFSLILVSTLFLSAPGSVVEAASPITLRSTTGGTNGSGSTSLVLAMPAGTQSGDVLIAQIVINSASAVITAPSGWSLILTTKSSSSVEEATFYKAASESEPASYTWKFGASQSATGALSSYTGVNTTSPIDAKSGKYNGSTATATFAQITTTVANDMLLALVGVSGNTTVTPPTGFVEAYDLKNAASGNGRTAEMSQSLKATAGLTTVGTGKEDTLKASNLTQLIALKPATGTATSTATLTRTSTPTRTVTATITRTSTPTRTVTPTGTRTPTPTSSPTPSNTATGTTPTPAPVITLRSTTSGTNGSGSTSLVLNTPAGMQSGDLLIAQIVINSASTVITAPPGWNLILSTKSSSSVAEATFYKAALGSEPASYTWTFGASQPATGAVSSYTGVDTSSPIDAKSGKYNGSTATTTFTQITTTAANDMLLAFTGVSGNTTVTPPAGFAKSTT